MDIFRSMDSRWARSSSSRYANQPNADLFRRRLTAMGNHELSALSHSGGTPNDIDHIVSDEGWQERVHRDRTSARGGDGSRPARKMATCLAALSRAQARVTAGYAKYDVLFGICRLTHPVNIAYEAGPIWTTTTTSSIPSIWRPMARPR